MAIGAIFLLATFFLAFFTLCFITGVELAAGADIPSILPMSSAQTAWTATNSAIPINRLNNLFITFLLPNFIPGFPFQNPGHDFNFPTKKPFEPQRLENSEKDLRISLNQ